jgi:hypothetical protein
MNDIAAKRSIFVWVAILLSFCCLGALGVQSPAEGADAERLWREFQRPGYGDPIDWEKVRALSDEKRSLLIEHWRSRVEDAMRREPQEDFRNSSMVLYMAILGDDWAIIQTVNYFLAHGTRAAPNKMQALSSPKAISLIGEGLFKDEKLEWAGDVGLMPTQVTVANVILYTLGNSPEFNENVVNWARRVSQNYNMKMMRDWYQANEAKLKAWDFKAVQPGEEPPGRNASAPADGSQSSVPPPSTPASTPAPSPGDAHTQDSFGNMYAWIAASLLAVGGGSLVWLVKRKRSQ